MIHTYHRAFDFVKEWLPDWKRRINELEERTHQGTQRDLAYTYFVDKHFPEAITVFTATLKEKYAKLSKTTGDPAHIKENDPVLKEFTKDYTPAMFVSKWLPDCEKRVDLKMPKYQSMDERETFVYKVDKYFRESFSVFTKAIQEEYAKLSAGVPVQIKVNDPVLKEFTNGTEQDAFGYIIAQNADNYQVQCCCGTYLVKEDDIKKATVDDVANFDRNYQDMRTRLSQEKSNKTGKTTATKKDQKVESAVKKEKGKSSNDLTVCDN